VKITIIYSKKVLFNFLTIFYSLLLIYVAYNTTAMVKRYVQQMVTLSF